MADSAVDSSEATMQVALLNSASTPQGISASGYSIRRRQLVSLIDQLRAAGASTEIDLPRIAVIGNQSAGKSSLVEAISGIKVPRDAGTVNCRIALRFETDPAGRPIETVRELAFGGTMHDPEQVEVMLRRAQLAILNQASALENLAYFVGLPQEELRPARADTPSDDVVIARSDLSNSPLPMLAQQQAFSTNVICVEVAGPDITDLAFLDLPGIISNADDKRDIELIEDMVRKSISGNTLILLTVTMKDDFQNQKAVLMAKEADPDGKRTIGVLTKADTVQRGEHTPWLELVEVRRHQLAHGFFVCKQPGTEDLAKNLSFQDARAAEVDFFKSEEPWNTLAPHIRRQLGTGHLVAFLSDRLARYISEKLPQIRSDLVTSLNSVHNALKELPPAPSSDPVGELHIRLAALARDLDSLMQGTPGRADLVQAKNREDQRYKADIRATRPVFVPFTASDEEETLRAAWEQQHRSTSGDSVDALRMDLDALQLHIKEHKGREVPLNTPYGAKTSLMVRAMTQWPILSNELLERMRGPVNDSVSALIRRHFESSDAELFGITTMVVSEVVESLFARAAERIEEHLELEGTPFTLNDHYFAKTREDLLSSFREARRPTAAVGKKYIDWDHVDVTDALSALAACGYPGITADQLPRLLGPDKFEEALDAAAQTRMIDTIPRIIDSAVIRPLPASIGDALLKRLVANGDDEVRRLMAEPAVLAEERAELNMRKNRLEEAKRVFASFGRSLE
ncbi:hypothetical protein BMF94_1832 [Rhodotorula taiwanensis]|uniref:Dynamin-type G domain-containing protein n=1 Tax=Rhodotorula taiwanensis TaxID=741276 RepID=A0A2S5BEL7_9BASI|nr:hypothetical protein BMF94_1832 [Rhodotorula taiwanensis]